MVARLVEVEGCHISQKDCVDNALLGWVARNGVMDMRTVLPVHGGDDFTADKPHGSG